MQCSAEEGGVVRYSIVVQCRGGGRCCQSSSPRTLDSSWCSAALLDTRQLGVDTRQLVVDTRQLVVDTRHLLLDTRQQFVISGHYTAAGRNSIAAGEQ